MTHTGHSLALALAVTLAAAAACGPAHKPAPEPRSAPPPGEVTFGALDSYGSAAIGPAQLEALEPDARRLPTITDEAELTKVIDAMKARVNALGDFAYVRVSMITYFQAGGQVAYVTIDVVERADAARRMTFRAAPTGSYPDPEGLLATWDAYEEKFFELLEAGKIAPDYKPCPAWHCLGDYAHPELAPLAEKLITRVPPHRDELIKILTDDADAKKRGAAAFALAHIPDGPRVVEVMLIAMTDGDELVRNNAIRVLADIAFHHPDLDLPLEPFLGAMDWPNTTDRNKALAVVAGLLDRPDGARYRDAVARGAGATLLRLLRLEQPNNHDFAWKILQAVSGLQHDDRDYAAWEAWLGTVAPAPAPGTPGAPAPAPLPTPGPTPAAPRPTSP